MGACLFVDNRVSDVGQGGWVDHEGPGQQGRVSGQVAHVCLVLFGLCCIAKRRPSTVGGSATIEQLRSVFLGLQPPPPRTKKALQNSTECCLEFTAAAVIECFIGCLVSYDRIPASRGYTKAESLALHSPETKKANEQSLCIPSLRKCPDMLHTTAGHHLLISWPCVSGGVGTLQTA